jgi:hypothetical protein
MPNYSRIEMIGRSTGMFVRMTTEVMMLQLG